MLQLPAAQFEPGREREDPLCENVIDERHAQLERVRHRETVGEREDVVGEVDLVIEIERRGETAGRASIPVQAAQPLARRASGERSEEHTSELQSPIDISY